MDEKTARPRQIPPAPEDVPVRFVDMLIESRLQGGTVYLTFASSTMDGGQDPVARIASRLRFTIPFTEALIQALTNKVLEAKQTKPASKASVPPSVVN